MLDVKDKEQIKEIVRDMLREDDHEKKLSLIERIVRVEEGIKNNQIYLQSLSFDPPGNGILSFEGPKG